MEQLARSVYASVTFHLLGVESDLEWDIVRLLGVKPARVDPPQFGKQAQAVIFTRTEINLADRVTFSGRTAFTSL